MTQPLFKRAYTSARPDVLALIPAEAIAVLDVGCSTGALGAAVKARKPMARVVGIELDEAMAAQAITVLDEVLVVSLEQVELPPGPFDCIVCADVLEHVVDPWGELRRLAERLDSEGKVVISIPNIGHLDTFVNVFVRGVWPYRTRGIHDATHLRFFARRNVDALLAEAGLELVQLRRNFRIFERPNRLNRLAPLLALPGLRSLLTFQFLIVARKANAPAVVRRWAAPGH